MELLLLFLLGYTCLLWTIGYLLKKDKWFALRGIAITMAVLFVLAVFSFLGMWATSAFRIRWF